MKLPCAIPLALVAGLLAGCSATPTQVAVPLTGAARNPLVLGNQTRSHGWVLPAAKKMDLLYVSDNDRPGQLLAFSYPEGALVGDVTVPSEYPVGLCSDSAGNVFVPTADSVSQSSIYEYAHGGTQPIATLTDPGLANGCAIDRVTGNLAVTNYLSTGGSQTYYGDVAIFAEAKGTPSTYFDPEISFYDYDTYDDDGNLYVDGETYTSTGTIGELPSGTSLFSNITLTKSIRPFSMQWTGGRLVVSTVICKFCGPQPIYEIRVSDGNGVVSGPVLLHSPRNLNPAQPVQFWLQGSRMIGPDRVRGGNGLVNFWHYPAGGWPRKIIRRPGHAFLLYGVTISKADQHSAPVIHSEALRPPEALISR